MRTQAADAGGGLCFQPRVEAGLQQEGGVGHGEGQARGAATGGHDHLWQGGAGEHVHAGFGRCKRAVRAMLAAVLKPRQAGVRRRRQRSQPGLHPN